MTKSTYKEKLMENQFSIQESKLTHSFALKMARMICFSVMAMVAILGTAFGERTLPYFIVLTCVGIFFGIISFFGVRSAIV